MSEQLPARQRVEGGEKNFDGGLNNARLNIALSLILTAFPVPGNANWFTDIGDSIHKNAEHLFNNSVGSRPDVNRPPYPAPQASPPAVQTVPTPVDSAMEKRAKNKALIRAQANADERQAAMALKNAAKRKAAKMALEKGIEKGTMNKVINVILTSISQNEIKIILKKSLGSITLVITLDGIATAGLHSNVDSWANKIVIQKRINDYLRNNPNATESDVRKMVIDNFKYEQRRVKALEAKEKDYYKENAERARQMGKPGNIKDAWYMFWHGHLPPLASQKPLRPQKTYHVKTFAIKLEQGEGPLAGCRNAGVPEKLLKDCAAQNANATKPGDVVVYHMRKSN